MRILYHHRTRGKSVEGIHIREIVNALRKLGNEVHVVSMPGADPMVPRSKFFKAKPKNISSKIWDWISGHFPQIGFEVLELCYNFVGYCQINRALKRHKIDAIYERYAFFAWIGTFMARKNNIPIILEVNEVSGIERVRGQILVGLVKWIEGRVFRAADAIVVVSDFLKRHIAENMGVNIEKIHVMPNAVDPEKFNPNIDDREIRRRLGLENKLVIGFVGSFVVWSKLELLLKAFSEVSKEKSDVHLMLVGDGLARGALERIVREEKLEGKVKFAGIVDHEDIPKFISAMDICIIPQSNKYRSPVKLFEYMAMAKPVIAPRLEPIERIVAHGENGILFEQEGEESSVDAIKAAIMYLLESDKDREKLAFLACKTVLGNYTWLRNAERILDIYNPLLARNAI